MRQLSGRARKPDYGLLVISAGLLAVGLVVVYAVSPGMSILTGVSQNYFVSKQTVAILLGAVAFFLMSRLPYQLLGKLLKLFVVLSFLSVIAVQVFGEEINGAHRWIQVGGISFQPVELVKLTVLIWTAEFLSRKKKEGQLGGVMNIMKPIGLVLFMIAVGVAVLQSDFGSTVVMVSMMVAMMFVSGVPFANLIKLALVVLVGAILLVAPSEYRRGRVATFLNPTADCQGDGYQSCQALIAVGSGGLFGLGLARSVQAYGYLPEAANDSIFAIVAEKFGFLGVSIIIAMFATLIIKFSKIADRAPDDFSRLIVVGVMVWFSVQAMINIGAMLGLLPLKGITLPFISYGGTSLLFVMGALGLVFQISKYGSLVGNNRTGIGYEDNARRRGQRRPYNTAVGRRA